MDPGDDRVWKKWGESAERSLRETYRWRATKLIANEEGAASSSSSSTNVDEHKAIFIIIDLAVGAAAAATAATAVAALAPGAAAARQVVLGARQVVLGCREFYRQLTEGADDSESESRISARSSSTDTAVSEQSKLTSKSVYTFISSVEQSTKEAEANISSFIDDEKRKTDKLHDIGETSVAQQEEKLEMISVAVSGGGSCAAEVMLNALVPSSCALTEGALARQELQRHESNSSQQVSSIASSSQGYSPDEDMNMETESPAGCESNMQIIVSKTLNDVIGQLEAGASRLEANEGEAESGGRRRRTRKHRKATKGRKTRKQHRVRKTHKYRRPRKSRKGRKSRKY
jgi:hypothetical protein